MAEHVLRRDQTISLPRDRVFAFHSDAANLELITPAHLNFRITSPQPIEMRAGALIEYELRLHRVPFRWKTEITEWDPPNGFVDVQAKGPYAQWVHKHTFTAVDENTTLIEDEVRYRLPLEPVGEIAHFLIARELKKIFDFRHAAIERALAA